MQITLFWRLEREREVRDKKSESTDVSKAEMGKGFWHKKIANKSLISDFCQLQCQTMGQCRHIIVVYKHKS